LIGAVAWRARCKAAAAFMIQVSHRIPAAAPTRSWSGLWVALLLILLALAGALLSLYGRAFYALDLDARADHPDRELLNPGAPIGHGYGVVGTALILTNLLYVVRRRLASARLGSMRAWLNLHATTGLFGTLLVAFHSAFQLRSPIATTTMIALSVVVFTGIIGRFIFAFNLVPDGDRLQQHFTAFDSLGHGMGRELRERLAQVPPPRPGARYWLLRAIFALPGAIRRGRQRARIVQQVAAEHEGAHLAEVYPLRWRIAESVEIAGREAWAPIVGSIMRSWRGLHRFAAILMILLVSVHIAVAWVFGYRWIFSS
jgi:hypothetical protein